MQVLDLIASKALLETQCSRVRILLADAKGQFLVAAEAVRDGLSQIRYLKPDLDFASSPEVLAVMATSVVAVDDYISEHQRSIGASATEEVCSRLSAPVIRGDALVGVVTFEQTLKHRDWEADRESVRRAQDVVVAHLASSADSKSSRCLAGLRSEGIQAILDGLRLHLNAHRCTFRQDWIPGYSFAVAYESRADGVRPLLGDFTIVQNGQPVIEMMLKHRKQVVQGDCSIASEDPQFKVMLGHYGGMRSQIVTPFIENDAFVGALSVHDLKQTRTWTVEEMKLAEFATSLIGAMVRIPV
jgi:GAF domain-containing protein